MTDHAHELRRYARKIAHPAGDVPAVMLAAADEIERLQSVIAGLRADFETAHARMMTSAAVEREAALMARLEAAEKERDALRARIEAMERRGPVAWRTFDGEGGYDYRSYADNENYQLGWNARNPNHAGWVEPLYLAPGAQPAPNVPEGWKLVPIEPTPEMIEAASGYHSLAMAWRAAINAAPEAKP